MAADAQATGGTVLARGRGFRQNSCQPFSEPAMFSDQIEQMKRQYTDKYVLVDAARPELARFRDVVGRVKTVNMNGRALVEFDDYHLNTGWYDIAPEYLKVVDKPPPKAPKTEKKPAAKAEAKPAAKPAASGGSAAAAKKQPAKSSVADILAAARAGKTGGATPAPASPKAEKPASAPASSAAAPAKADRAKMSVADMLAAARAGGAGTEPKAAAPTQAAAPAETPAAPTKPAPAPAAAPAPAGEVQRVDKSGMSVDQMVAYCREHDAA
jgi:hypothetical protein